MMPRLNGTGPQGQGSMTGRGLGKCNTSMGMSLGGGRGRGFLNNNRNCQSRDTLEELKSQRDAIEKRIAFLESDNAE